MFNLNKMGVNRIKYNRVIRLVGFGGLGFSVGLIISSYL